MRVAHDGHRAEEDRAEAGFAATVDRDNPIGVADLEAPEEDHGEGHGEAHGDSTC